MLKKVFGLASVTALMGVVGAVCVAACSSSPSAAGSESIPDGGEDGGEESSAPPEGGPEEAAAPGLPEEGTVGKRCTTTADCKVSGTKNDNICARAFAVGDIWGTSVCIQQQCKQGSGTALQDLQCDGLSAAGKPAGLCLPVQIGSKTGVCLPFCDFNSNALTTRCEGTNKCNLAYTDAVFGGVGFCFGACQADGDCQGTAGQKCQVETGLCSNPGDLAVYPKLPGEACTVKTPSECNCSPVGGAGPDKEKGVCTRQCITGAGGDAACEAAVPGWTCTVRLPIKDAAGKVLFTGQPDDLSGTCALPCVDDATCAPLQSTLGLPVRCKELGGGKWCDITAM